jgi:hypothetical protein
MLFGLLWTARGIAPNGSDAEHNKPRMVDLRHRRSAGASSLQQVSCFS